MANPFPVQWDPISKQPTFKSGAIRIEKLPDGPGPHIKERQSVAIELASKKDAVGTTSDADLKDRVRQLELWLGETFEAIVQLLEIFDKVIPKLIHDVEVSTGLAALRGLAEDARVQLEGPVRKYGENQQRGSQRAHILRKALFPPGDEHNSPYEVLEALQGLHLYLSHIEGGLSVLVPASQASWDADFEAAVRAASHAMHRMQSWTDQQMRVRSPQTLLVPTPRSQSQA